MTKPFFPSTGKRVVPLSELPNNDELTLVRKNARSGDRAIWAYKFSTLIKPVIPEVISNLQKHQINIVFLSVSNHWLTKYPSQLRNFIQEAHGRGIEIHAMTLEDSHFIEAENTEEAQRRIGNILSFCKENPADAFDGIHLDAEPHTHPIWKKTRATSTTPTDWRVREGLMKQYLRLIKKTERQIKGSRLPLNNSGKSFQFSAATGWWYDEQARNGNIPSAKASTLGSYLDFLVPMVYDGKGEYAEEIIRCVKNVIKDAPTMIGVAVKEFPDFSEFAKAVHIVESRCESSKNYRGVCIFRYQDFVTAASPSEEV